MRTRVLITLTAVALVVSPIPAAAAGRTRASLTDIENDVMCVACHESLAVAQSPQAQAERNYIRTLIAQGEDKAQIERNLVAQYGSSVLGRPPARGFNLTVYILPPAVLVIGLAILAIVLPRWRRRTREERAPAAQVLDPGEARRLEEDLARYGG